jgi:UPF0755 protein
MARQRRPRIGRWIALATVAALIGSGAWFASSLQRVGPGKAFYYRVDKPTPLGPVLANLEKKGIIRSAFAVSLLARFQGRPATVRIGTFRLSRQLTGLGVLRSLEDRIRQMVRIPETNWAARTSRLLARAQVCSATEYMACLRSPEQFQSLVPFPLPKDSLEGYLYPDTYDLPPLMGATGVIARQLLNFQNRVWEPLHHPTNLSSLITMGSLIEMEVNRDNERPRVSAVIHNRIKKKMRLQIDAAINYGIQKWRPLTRADYKNVDSPYNLYLHDGLPPTPICSPTLPSIQAARSPSPEKSLYYVALPSGQTLFAVKYSDHLKNIRLRRAALEALKKP